jgi:ABC-type multidrug transport system fused ATPase/permease subunit
MKKDSKNTLFKSLKNLIPFLGRRRLFQLILLQLLSFISSILEAFSVSALVPYLAILSDPFKILKYIFLKKYLSLLHINNPQDLIIIATILFITLMTISSFLKWLLMYLNLTISALIESDLGSLIYKKSLYQNYTYHTNTNSTEILKNLHRPNEIVSNIITPILNGTNAFFLICFILTGLIIVNPEVIMLIFILVALFYIIIMYFVRKKISIESIKIDKVQIEISKVILESLGAIRSVIINSNQNYYTNIYKKHVAILRSSKKSLTQISNTPGIFIQNFGIILLSIFAAEVTIRNTESNTLISGITFLGAIAFAYLKIVPALQTIYTAWSNIKNAENTLSIALTILNLPLPYIYNKSSNEKISFNKIIILKNVFFKYNNQSDFILHDINLEIKKGERVGIIGETGTGKSTLIDIILGLYLPTKGSLIVDDVVIDATNYQSWQKNIAEVPQAIFLSDTTIAENIAFGTPYDNIDFNLVRSSAKKAQIFDMIEQHEDKFFAKVGERGIRVSGGQKQRIGIARALYKQNDILIFDEATSALDNDTENMVMEAINNLSKDLTIIIIAHRLSTLKECDQIYEIKQGKLFSHGNYVNLTKLY